MVILGSVIEIVLWVYILLLLARVVAEWVQMFAHSWSPRGPLLVGLEVIYTVTDPPINLVRRFIPPLRLGGVAIDLSILLVLVVCYVLLQVNRSLLPIG